MNKFKKKKFGLMSLEKRLMLDASITGAALWLDASDKTTILDAQGDNANAGAAFSGSVATWVDKSGNGRNVTNGTAAQQPTYGSNTLNSLGTITFDGTTDRLTNAGAIITGSAVTTFVVFNRTTATGRDAVFELGGTGVRDAIYINNTASQISYYTNSTFSNLSGTYTPGTYALLSTVHNGTALSADRDAAAGFNGTALARGTSTGIYIGDDSSSGDQLQGNIAEIIVFDYAMTADQRHYVENYLAGKWGLTITDAPPTVVNNTGAGLTQGSGVFISSINLLASDPDNSSPSLEYHITDAVDHGTLYNTNTGLTLGVGDFFRQSDISGGYILYNHDGSANFSDSFSFNVTDFYASTAPQTFNFTMTPSNMAPVIGGWTLVSSENFESGATGWSDNTTETSNPYLTRFLGRHSLEGGLQNTYKTYTLSGSEDYAVVTFDLYKIDSWDGENFRVFINDTLTLNASLNQGVFNQITDGSSGVVSWQVQELTPFNANFVYGSWSDQIMRVTMLVQTNGTSLKLGFSSTLDQAVADEAWGVDNVKIYEIDGTAVPGPYAVAENSANGSTFGTVTAKDPNAGDILTYSIVGGTGAGVFNINSSTGVLSVANSSLLNYEAVTSYTLQVRVTDNGTPSLSDTETITINIIDVPENTAPVIPATGPFSVAENAANNTVVGTVTATDAESNTITYAITGGNTAGVFAINAATGAIRILSNANLNYEGTPSYTLTVSATDNGFGNLVSTRNVTINVTNINEAPVFDPIQQVLAANPGLQYNATTGNFYRYVATGSTYAVATSAAAAATLNGIGGHLVTVTSAAENTFVRSLNSGSAFWMGGSDSGTEGSWVWTTGAGAESGALFWLGNAAGSAQGGYYTNWTASQPDDSGGNEDALQMQASGTWNDAVATTSLGYVVEWEGTTVMSTLQNGPYTIAENVAIGTSVGFAHSADPDAADTRTYSVTGGTGFGLFAINATTGEITTSAAINYEAGTSYTLNLRVQDAGGLFDTKTVTINITDVNETPILNAAGPFTFPENTAAGTLVTTMVASDPDTGQTLTYSIQSGNVGNMFSINGATGAITFAQVPNYENSTGYVLVVRVTDNGTGTLFAQRSIIINISNVNEAPAFDPVQQVLNSDPTLRYNATSGNFYRYVNTLSTIGAAQTAAGAATLFGQAGHLLTISSASENALIQSMITSSAWLDANDSTTEGSWVWNSGPDAGQLFWLGVGSGSAQNGYYTNWNGGEPNNSGGAEDGAQILTTGRWNDTNLAGTNTYVIEWEGAAILAARANGPYTVAENTAIGTSVGFAHAVDPDTGNTITYSVTGGSGSGLFAINSTTGEITTTGALNYEAATSYTLNLRVQDNFGALDTRTVTINLTDVNEVPVLNPAGPFTFAENIAAGTFVTTMVSSDVDGGQTRTYSIQSGNNGNLFAINAATGQLRFLGSPNYELQNAYNLVIRVTDNGTPSLYAEQTVAVNITNVNEAPVFDPIQQVLANDPTLRYSAATGNFYRFVAASSTFATARTVAAGTNVDGVTGHLVTITSAAENAFVTSLITSGSSIWIDASDAAVEGEWRWMSGPEAGQLFWLGTSTGSAQNGFYNNWNGGEPNNSSNEDGIQLFNTGGWNDINTGGGYGYVIEFEGASILAARGNGPFTVVENTAPGTSVGFVHSADPDVGDTRTYSITGGTGSSLFSVNATTGEIIQTGAINYEAASSYTLNMRIQDAGGLFDTMTVTINITDVNEVPVLAPAGPFAFNENIAPGTVVTTMSAVDQDPADTLTYTIQSGNTGGMFAINSSTGQITFTGSPDFETVSGYNLVIRVTDNGTGNLYAEQTVAIAINDLNEVPVLNPAGPFSFNENVPAGTPVTTMVAADQDTADTLTYTIQSGNTGGMFTINASTGAITFAGSPNYEALALYNLVIRVTDNGTGNLYAEETVTININDINDRPDQVNLSHNRIEENSAIGTWIGNLSTIDQDSADTHIYSLVTNPGGKFIIVGNELRTNGAIDYEANQFFNIVIRTDDGNGGTLNRTFLIRVDDVMDTYVPPPTGPAPNPGAPPTAAIPDDIRAPSLLRASLEGGEFGQSDAFYGDVHQIIREGVTYEVRDLMDKMIADDALMAEGLNFDRPQDEAVRQTDDPQAQDRFTNLRHALKFFESLKDAETVETADELAAQKLEREKMVAARALPDNTIDRQFVDVLTYHEQRQAKLREALKQKTA